MFITITVYYLHHRCVGRVGDTTLAARPRTRAVQDRSANIQSSAPQRATIRRYLGPLVAIADLSDLPGRRALRSASTSRLVIPPIKLSTVGSRALAVAAAQVRNSLSEAVISSSSLQSFRRQLKTHLFQLSYPHLILWLLVWHRYSGLCCNVVI